MSSNKSEKTEIVPSEFIIIVIDLGDFTQKIDMSASGELFNL